ncbi:MAG: hypothetical protein ACJAVA_001915 [Flavobacteriaceae bacterium]|jgi:hypothetical protein
MKNINLNHYLILVLSFITSIVCFFPYLTIYSFGTDLQPTSIVFVTAYAVILFILRISFKRVLVFLTLPFSLSILLMLLDENLFFSIRSVVGYTTILLVPWVFLYILNNYNRIFIFTLKFSTIVYLIIALIQYLFDRGFLTFLLSRARTTHNRGVVSLSTEPTTYGLICLFFILIFIALNIPNKKKYILILLLQIIFLAQSSMVILLLLIFYCYHIIFNLNLKNILIGFVCLIILLLFFSNIDLLSNDSRLIVLIKNVINHPMQILTIDASVNDRASAIYFSIKGFVDNYFLPNGFSSYEYYLNSELPKQHLFFQDSSRGRIMSYYGGMLYELGIFGLLIPITYSIIIIKSYASNVRSMFLYLLFFNTILFSAIPMSFPFVGIYLACLIYRKESNSKINAIYDFFSVDESKDLNPTFNPEIQVNRA